VALLFLSDDRVLIERMRSRPLGRPAIIGDVDEVRETVRAYRDAGVDELIVPDFTLGPRDQKLATLDRFIREVAAPLR
jgi:alkanesulfonate monooxygenase SsuD/methylene tetrahydromethanopterin reductase-like flavin-dependent oxidoreductase (luciferase family)